MDASPGNEQRLVRRRKHCCGCCDLAKIRTGPADVVQSLIEELHGEVVGLSCDVLGQPDIGRTAFGRIEHDGQCLRQGLDDLLRTSDAVPETRNRPKDVTHGR